MDLRVESQAAPRRITVELTGPTRNPPDEIRLHLPTPERIRSVQLNDEDFKDFKVDRQAIRIRGGVEQARWVISY